MNLAFFISKKIEESGNNILKWKNMILKQASQPILRVIFRFNWFVFHLWESWETNAKIFFNSVVKTVDVHGYVFCASSQLETKL